MSAQDRTELVYQEGQVMPAYDYKCETCGGTTEVLRELGEDREPTCCNQIMTRIWSAVPVHFKTGGFYKTGG